MFLFSEAGSRFAIAEAEKRLVDRVLQGEQHAFAELIEQYQALVSHIVARMVSTNSDREELCQEVFVKLYQNLRSFQFKSKLSTYIGRIAYNSCINFLKKSKPHTGGWLESGTPERGSEEFLQPDHPVIAHWQSPTQPDDQLIHDEISGFLQQEIERLTPLQRIIITLFHVDEMSIQEICDITMLPKGTVKSHLFRGRKALKERLLEKYTHEDVSL